jgi:hypothetical protein
VDQRGFSGAHRPLAAARSPRSLADLESSWYWDFRRLRAGRSSRLGLLLRTSPASGGPGPVATGPSHGVFGANHLARGACRPSDELANGPVNASRAEHTAAPPSTPPAPALRRLLLVGTAGCLRKRNEKLPANPPPHVVHERSLLPAPRYEERTEVCPAIVRREHFVAFF